MPDPPHSRLVRLLDVAPELASRLREDDRAEARERLRLRLTTVPAGPWSPAADATLGHALGLMVVDGVLLQEVLIGGRRALQILGPGDVVLPDHAQSDALKVSMRWTAAVETQVAVLDDRLQRPFAMWPGLALALVQRTGDQLARTAVQAAIAQLPRVEDRLEATFWDLADRWGRVTPSGIHIPLKLTHEALAQLVGGRRPTITLALGELADRGVVTRRPDRTWLLVARRPTLPRNDSGDDPSSLAVEIVAPDAKRTVARPDPRRELVATARRLRAENEARKRELTASLGRYAEARRRSRTLRDEIARYRAARGSAGQRRPTPDG